MNRILKVAGRPCSCPEGRVCSACTVKKQRQRLKPRIHVSTPRNPQVPIKVTHFHEKPALVKIKESLSSLKFRSSPREENTWKVPRKSLKKSISTWYGRRQAVREQKKLEEKEKKELLKAQKQYKKDYIKEQKLNEKILYYQQIENDKREKDLQQKEREKEVLKFYKDQEEQRRKREREIELARQEREKEILKHFEDQEEHLRTYYTPQLRSDTAPDYGKEVKEKKVKPKREKKVKRKKEKKIKEKKIKVKKEKPQIIVTDKIKRRRSFKERFDRCFYRFCCELYCYLTCTLAAVVIILLNI